MSKLRGRRHSWEREGEWATCIKCGLKVETRRIKRGGLPICEDVIEVKPQEVIEPEKPKSGITKYVSYYHKVFKSLNILPGEIKKIEDLEKLPVLTKDIIKKNWEDFKPVNLDKIKYYNGVTGGSTGTPLKYRLEKFDRFLR